MMEAEFVKVYEAPHEADAVSILALLSEAGIAAVPYPHGGGMEMIIGTGYGNGSWGEIVVRCADEEKALELIGGFLGSLGMLEEAEVEQEPGSTIP